MNVIVALCLLASGVAYAQSQDRRSAAAAVPPDLAGFLFDRKSSDTASRADAEALEREIVRRVVKADPGLLDNRDAVASLLQRYASGRTVARPDIAELYRQYREGTEFDQDRALDGMKAFLRGQATDAPLKVLRIRRASVGRYDPKQNGFPLVFSNASEFGQSMYLVGAFTVSAIAEDWEGVPLLPAAPGAAEGLVKNVGPGRSVDVVVRLTLRDFRADRESVGGRAATADIERITAHYLPTRSDVRLGSEIVPIVISRGNVADVAAPAQPVTGAPIETWKVLGAAADGRRLTLAASGAQEGGANDSRGFIRSLTLYALAARPEIAKAAPNVYAYSAQFLTRGEHASLFTRKITPKYLQDLNNDRFQRKDVIERFAREFLPALTARAPRLPVDVRFAGAVRIGDYDFDRKVFPIIATPLSLEGAQVVWRVDGGLAVETDIARLPDAIRIDETKARAVSAAARAAAARSYSQWPEVYVGIDATITRIATTYSGGDRDSGQVGGADGASGVGARPYAAVTRIAYYSDAALTKPILELPLTGALKPPPAPDPFPADLVGAAESLSAWALVGLAERHGAGADFFEEVAKTTSAYRVADEFSRAQTLVDIVTAARGATPAEGAVMLLPGTVELGAHDGRSGFDLRDVRFATRPTADASRPADNAIAISVRNPEMLARLQAGEALSRALVAASPKRTFAALFRVTFGAAERVSAAKAELAIEIEEVMLLHPTDDRRVVARAGRIAAEASAPALASAPGEMARPERMPLTSETLALLLIKHSGKEPDEATLKWLMLQRWEAENSTLLADIGPEPQPWGTFFPAKYRALTDADVARFMPNFRRWTAARVASLPDKLLYRRDSSTSTFKEARLGDAARAHVPVMDRIGVGVRDPALTSSGAFEFSTTPAGQTVMQGGMIGFRRDTPLERRAGSLSAAPRSPRASAREFDWAYPQHRSRHPARRGRASRGRRAPAASARRRADRGALVERPDGRHPAQDRRHVRASSDAVARADRRQTARDGRAEDWDVPSRTQKRRSVRR